MDEQQRRRRVLDDPLLKRWYDRAGLDPSVRPGASAVGRSPEGLSVLQLRRTWTRLAGDATALARTAPALDGAPVPVCSET